MDSGKNQPTNSNEPRDWRMPDACSPMVHQLFSETSAERWELSYQTFLAALTRGAAKRFAESTAPIERFQEYFATLHARDLALACACAEGSHAAWNDFVREYRDYLVMAAAAVMKRPAADPAVRDLADSLFAELYGLTEGQAGRRSLFRYFHGRSSLKTWLRAVIAQRHIDLLRAGRKFDSLDTSEDDGETRRPLELATVDSPTDPHRESYLQKFREALSLALASLEARDRKRLRLYYAQDCTLAEIGRELCEHESSVSRNLDRIRKQLRGTVEGLLRAGKAAANGGPKRPGMDDAQIALCIQYAGEDAGIDLDKLFASRDKTDLPGTDRVADP